jgi:hypothetical protein
MSKENEADLARIIPNEVILVGVLKDGQDAAAKIALQIDGVDRPIADVLADVRKRFKFIRDTNLSEAAKAVGFQTGKFFHIQMGDPGGETITLPNGQKVRRSRKTTKPGFDVIFAQSRATTFEEIKEEILAGRFTMVGGDPNSGKVRLTEYALMGFWDEFSAGFWFTPHQYDPKQGGKLMPLMSHPKLPDGTYSKVGEPAKSNSGRHFIYEDEIYNLEALRDAKRSQFEKWKITVSDNTKPAGEAGTGADPKIEAEKKPEPPKTEDDI